MKASAPPGGRLRLALDTSTPVGSVAVGDGERVVARALLTRQTRHASGLLPAMDEALAAAGVGLDDVDTLVVGEGPGSFTGVRVAAATAKGLVRALGIPLHAVSSLMAEALAHEGPGVRYALFDARAERVYGACYEVETSGVGTLVAPHAAELRELLAGDVPAGATFYGDGALKHRGAIEGAGFAVASTGDEPSLADGLLRFLALRPETWALKDPASWEPAYVRVSGAERMWTT